MTESDTDILVTTVHLPPMERSPLECSYGFFIADAPGYGGAQGFCWFEAEIDALNYLRDELCQLYDPEMNADNTLVPGNDELHMALENVLKDVTRLKAIPAEQLNDAAQGQFELRWAGSYFDLESGNEPFEKEVQADFHGFVFPDERGQTDSAHDDFAQHLLNYHG